MGELSLEERINGIILWQKRFTETAPPESLLQSWGTIALTRTHKWPDRGIKTSQLLRGILPSFDIGSSSVSGLHSLPWLSRHDRALNKLALISANAGHNYPRWFLSIDPVMTSNAEIKPKVFGPGSRQHRKLLGVYLVANDWWLGYCPVCGNAMETGHDRTGGKERCKECFLRPCDICEPEDHVCPMKKAPEGAGVW